MLNLHFDTFPFKIYCIVNYINHFIYNFIMQIISNFIADIDFKLMALIEDYKALL